MSEKHVFILTVYICKETFNKHILINFRLENCITKTLVWADGVPRVQHIVPVPVFMRWVNVHLTLI